MSIQVAQSSEQIFLALLEWVIIGGVGIWLVFHVATWIKHYIPHEFDLYRLHHLKGRWFREAKRLWQRSEFPPRPFLGIYATMLAIGIEFLNLFLLAQIFAVYFPAGNLIDIPYLDSYYVFCLIMAAIFMLAQLFIGHTYYQPSRRGGQGVNLTVFLPRRGWFVLLCIAVGTEGFLSFFRAWLLNIGEIPEMGIIDNTIKNTGPIIAGLIGLLVPLTGITAGVMGLILYVEPSWPLWNSRVKALFFWIGAIVLRIFVCFHKRLPPLPFKYTIFPEVNKICSQREEWQRQVRNLQEHVKRMDPEHATPPPISEIMRLGEQVKDLPQRHKNYKAICQERIEELEDILNPEQNDRNRRYVLNVKAAQVKCGRYVKDIISMYDELISEKKLILKRSDEILSTHQKNVKFWEKLPNDRKDLRSEIFEKLNALNQQREQLEEAIEEEKKNWDLLKEAREKIAKLPDILEPNEVPEIKEHLLLEKLSEVKENRNRLTKVQSELRSVNLDAIMGKIQDADPDLQINKAKDAAQGAQTQINQLRPELNNLDIEANKIDILAEFDGIKYKLELEAKRLKKGWSPLWFLQQIVQRLFGQRRV